MQINQSFQGKIKFGDKNTSECLFKYVDPCQMLSSLLSRTGLLGGIMSLSYTLLFSHTFKNEKGRKDIYIYLCFPGGSDGKEYACNVGIMSLIPGSGRSLEERAWQPSPVFSPGESPWTEEPGWLQSMGSQRVGHD